MASLPVTIFKFAMSPYENWQKLAWAGVFLITLGVLALNILARVLFRNKLMTRRPRHGCDGKSSAGHREGPKPSSVRDLNFYYGKFPRAQEHQSGHSRAQGHGLHRPVGLRQEHAAAHLQPHVRALPGAARRGQILLDGENILSKASGRLLIRAKVGMVFQKPTPFPMSIYDNIAFGVRLFETCRASRWTSASSGR
jgi:energy-coupling factor transporter ATP-binding protein EcfA2